MNVLLWAGAVGALLFPVVFLIDGWTRPQYRPMYHPVSALALGRRGWIQTTNFVLSGTGSLGRFYHGSYARVSTRHTGEHSRKPVSVPQPA